MQPLIIKNIEIASLDSWLSYAAVVTVILSIDLFLINSVLYNAEVTFDQISLLGDNRVLISFDSCEKHTAFLGMKHSFKEFFFDIST